MIINSCLCHEPVFRSRHKKIEDTVKAALAKKVSLRGAILSGITLDGLDFEGVDLSGADLSWSNLFYTRFVRANLQGANLTNANFTMANLSESDLSDAITLGTNFTSANIVGARARRARFGLANFTNANLSCSDFSKAYLTGAIFNGTKFIQTDLTNVKGLHYQICPKNGAFTAWKKAGGYIIELKIPARAMRNSCINGRKCRAEYAIVVDIRNMYTNKQIGFVKSDYSCKIIYEIGKIVKPDLYDPDPRITCSHGINFFMTRKEAEEY